MRLEPITLMESLNAIGYRRTERLTEHGQYRVKEGDFLVKTRAFQFWDAQEASRTLQIRISDGEVAFINEIDPNRKLSLVRLEPQLIGKIYPNHNEDRILIQLAEVPELLKSGLLAMEDRSFYNHIGISFKGLARASVENLKARDWVQGGSTITQQLVKNLYLTPERTLDRKVNEAVMALLLEWHYSKDEIFQAYLNEVFLGQDGNRSIHGMGLGSQFYFNRPLSELKLPEIALLISLVRAASYYNPRKYPERAITRRNLVLDVMAQNGVITHSQADQAKNAPLGIVEEPIGSASPYPAFLELVQRQLREDYREKDLQSEGLQIFTTLDPYIQKVADQSMKAGIKDLEKWNRSAKKLQGAMVVTGTENGEILAFINGKDSHYAGFNRPLNAQRQIGSLVKVAVYLTALEDSRAYSLMTALDDSPYQWVDKQSGEVWKPQNYDFRSHGQVPLYDALQNSYNLATVRLGMKLGLNKIRDTLKRLGIERDFKVYPSMLLGSVALTPFEVAQMYQTIASGGFRVPLRSIREVLTHEGKPLQRYALSVEQRFDPSPIYLLNYALQRAVRHGTGRGVAKKFPENMILAGKTGSTNDLRDSWFTGFDSDLLTVTWLGRDDNKSIGLSGGKGAMYIWGKLIETIQPQSLAPVTPNRIQWRWVDPNLRIPFIVDNMAEANAAMSHSKQWY
jgi:penicillin-binding protein 1B